MRGLKVMTTQGLTYLFVGLTFSLYIGIAIWSKAKSTNDFYVAGKGVNPIANGMATAADWMSAASFLSMAGLIAFMGRDGSVYLMGWTGGYVLLALLLAPYLRYPSFFCILRSYLSCHQDETKTLDLSKDLRMDLQTLM